MRSVKGTMWIAGAEIAGKGTYLLILPVLLRLMTTGAYGALESARVAIFFFLPFLGLNLQSAVLRQGSGGISSLKTYVTTSLPVSLVSSLILCTLLLALNNFLSPRAWATEVAIWVLLGAILHLAVTWGLGVTRATEKPELFFVIAVLRNVLPFLVLFLAVSVFGSENPVPVFFLAFVPAAVSALLVSGPLLTGSFDRGSLRAGLRIGLPLIPHSLSGYLATFADRAIIGLNLGVGAVGVYSLGHNLGMMTAVANRVLFKGVQVSLLRKYAANDVPAVRLTNRVLLSLSAAFSVLLITLSFPFFRLFVPAAYATALPVVPLVVGAYFNNMIYLIASNVIYHTGKTELTSIATVSAAVVNIGLNVLLVPVYGPVGAAFATLATSCLQSSGVVVFARKIERSAVPGSVWSIANVVFVVAMYYVYSTS